MKRLLMMIMLMVVVMISIVSALSGQTLPVDSRKQVMQFFRDYEWQVVAPGDTLWARVDLPKGTMAVQLLSITDSVAVEQDSLYTSGTSIASGTPGLVITKAEPVWLPTWKKTRLWIRRSAAATASKVRLIFYKM